MVNRSIHVIIVYHTIVHQTIDIVVNVFLALLNFFDPERLAQVQHALILQLIVSPLSL